MNESQKEEGIFSAETESVKREREKCLFLFLFSLLLSKIYGNWTIGFCRSKKAKSVHASRATRGYQNLGVSSNSTR